ncbi:MAG TPA: hypothetical protein VIV11_20120 [Kofleriaceae bacterium]
MFSFDDFADGKVDTGYLGSRAAEMEATLSSKVRVPLPGKTAAELQAMADKLRTAPTDYSVSDVVAQVSTHAKFARNALRAAKFNLNLEAGEPTFTNVTVEAGALLLEYSLKVESLVKYKDLEAQMLTPAALVGQQIDMKLPLVIDGLHQRVGVKCSSDFDANAGAVPAEDLRPDNLFYYWHPERSGCPLAAADLSVSSYKVTSSNAQTSVYPEYDKLVADGKVTMVQIFGQIEHGELEDNDWGFMSYNDIKRLLEGQGFRVTKTYPNQHGVRLEKTMPKGLKIEIDMLTPIQFADTVDRELSNAAFREAMKTHEIVYYAGHAFYGSLTVLDEPTAYPASTYQIIFMDACWSYAYYTKQVFRNKATAADPTGWTLTDVVNNTEPGITGSERTAHQLWMNVFAGADAKHGGLSARRYSWNNLIKYMNEHAQRRADARGENNPEIYGVSGVRTNAFKP